MEETDLNFPSPASDDHCDLRGQLVCKAGTGVRESGVIIQLERKHPAFTRGKGGKRECPGCEGSLMMILAFRYSFLFVLHSTAVEPECAAVGGEKSEGAAEEHFQPFALSSATTEKMMSSTQKDQHGPKSQRSQGADKPHRRKREKNYSCDESRATQMDPVLNPVIAVVQTICSYTAVTTLHPFLFGGYTSAYRVHIIINSYIHPGKCVVRENIRTKLGFLGPELSCARCSIDPLREA
ncbi:reticulophagy regulator [Sarotherodon galilaeus]